MHRVSVAAALAFCFIGLTAPAAAQGADYSFSPFVSFLAPTGRTPLAGVNFTFSGTPDFGIRLNARSALRNTYAGDFSLGGFLPPWGADIDMVTALSGHPFGGSTRSASSYAFMGYGMSGRDTAAARIVSRNWSYGLGTTLPLGTILDLFADSRWRMQRFVLPTAKPHPERVKELRVGFTFHLGVTDPNSGRRGRR